jgi:hypothetical protein
MTGQWRRRLDPPRPPPSLSHGGADPLLPRRRPERSAAERPRPRCAGGLPLLPLPAATLCSGPVLDGDGVHGRLGPARRLSSGGEQLRSCPGLLSSSAWPLLRAPPLPPAARWGELCHGPRHGTSSSPAEHLELSAARARACPCALSSPPPHLPQLRRAVAAASSGELRRPSCGGGCRRAWRGRGERAAAVHGKRGSTRQHGERAEIGGHGTSRDGRGKGEGEGEEDDRWGRGQIRLFTSSPSRK